jgi:hypothetical protein
MREARVRKPVASRAARRAVWLGAGWTALVAGLLTVLAGWSVLGGVREVGHVVFLPLLVFNSAMGVWYLITAALVLSWRGAARWSAGLIAVGNGLVLMALLLLVMPVAPDSQAAMILRTGLWLAIAAALFWSFQPARE